MRPLFFRRCKTCPIVKPVFLCGSDNRTYSSLCRLDYHNCLHRSHVKITCKGFCPCKGENLSRSNRFLLIILLLYLLPSDSLVCSSHIYSFIYFQYFLNIQFCCTFTICLFSNPSSLLKAFLSTWDTPLYFRLFQNIYLFSHCLRHLCLFLFLL